MKKRKTKAEKMAEMDVQAAIYGLVIPMMSIPPMYKAMKAAALEGKSKAELRAIAASYPGVEESA